MNKAYFAQEALRPVDYDYFPTRHQAVIFRNWGCVTVDKLASVLQTDTDHIRACASEMGLDADPMIDPRWISRGYITIIRQNWQLLPTDQLLQLLDWRAEALDFALKEDDFLDYKLGRVKPICAPVVYRDLTEAEKQATKRLCEAVQRAPAAGICKPFDFLDELEKEEIPERRIPRDAMMDEIALDDAWGISFGANHFAAERFMRRMRARWGISLNGTQKMISFNRLSSKARDDETHTIHFMESAIVIDCASDVGELRALNTLESILEAAGAPVFRTGDVHRKARFKIRMVYPYSAVFGDAFIDSEANILPDGLLDRLATADVNAIWLHSVLYQMVEFPFDPSLSLHHEKRIEGLNRYIESAKRYGIRIYLYVNEPRAMRNAFFEKYPHLAGHCDGEFTSMCTSVPEVRAYLTNGMRDLFTAAPELGGVFIITMSENQTNCYSREMHPKCLRCAKRTPAEVTSEVCCAIEKGVHAVAPDADVLCWNWAMRSTNGFSDDAVPAYVNALPKDAWMLSTSETEMDINIGGIAGKVGDYTISNPGPGARAKLFWRAAGARDMRRAAKIQINNSWECASVPYLPVLDLIRTHMDNLAQEDVTGLILSWSLGGYPSQNLRMVSRYFWISDRDATVENAEAKAQRVFSDAFRNFPFSVDTLYFAPQNIGAANPLLAVPSGWEATMVGIPYDDLEKWRNRYPVDIFERQFKLLSDGWKQGVAYLEANAPESRELINISRAAGNQFESAYLQIRFVYLRDTNALPAQIVPVVKRQLEVIYDQIECIGKDSRIGFEASNHYFFRRETLLEAAIACEHLLEIYRN